MTHHTDIYHHKKTFISVSVSKYDLYSAFWKSVLFGCVYGYLWRFDVVLRPFNIYFGTMDSFSGLFRKYFM